MASPPLNNKGPILLSDEGESEEDYELLEGKEEWWSLLRVKTTTKAKHIFFGHTIWTSLRVHEEECNDEESGEEGSDYKECKCL